MRWLRAIRHAAWAVVALLALGAAALTLGWFADGGPAGRRVQPPVAAMPALGGPFTLRDVDGAAVTERDLLGRPSLIFFGFTHCPDVCPTTLGDVAGWMAELGASADRLQVFFVTVDPERDGPRELAAYAGLFDPRIRPLRGDETELAAIARAWRIVYRRVPLSGGGYTMDHTATLYLVGPDGRFAGTIAPQEGAESALPKLRRLIAIP
jgi:protein SCO1/2